MAMAAHDKYWTEPLLDQGQRRVTADAPDALGRTEEAKALRERYGIASSGRH
jgi:hypothetical protein